MATYLSHTQIGTLLKCGRMYRYRYIDRKPSVLNVNLFIGRIYHQTLAAAYNRKLVGGVISEEEVADVFSSFWEQSLANKYTIDESGEPQIERTSIEWQGVDPGDLKDRGITLSQCYCSDILPKYKPLEVETRKEITINGITLVGYLDLVAEINSRRIVADHKWRKRRFSDKEKDGDFQSTIYAILSGIPEFEFHAALDKQEPEVKVEPLHRTGEDINWVKGLIKEAYAQIRAGIFPPNPTSWSCSLEQCPYYVECRMRL